MTHTYNFSINTVLKNKSKTKLSALPRLNSKLIDAIQTLLTTTLGEDIKIVIAEEMASGSQFSENKVHLAEMFAKDISMTKLSLSYLDTDTVNLPYGKYDISHSYNYVSIIPVYVQTQKPISEDNQFIRFDQELMNYFAQCFEDSSAIGFGLGTSEELSAMFEVDFDCMFNIGRTLGVKYDDMNSEFETQTGHWAKEMYILPFFTLTSFSSAYFQSEGNILDKFYDWLRVFRATKAVFDLLRINYKTIKGLSSWLTTPITQADAKNTEAFEDLGSVYEEEILGLEDKESDKKLLPAQFNTFTEASTGVLCSFLNWKEDGHMVTKVYYPIGHEDIKALDSVKTDIKKKFSTVKDKLIELDGSNENMLLKQLNQPQLKKLT